MYDDSAIFLQVKDAPGYEDHNRRNREAVIQTMISCGIRVRKREDGTIVVSPMEDVIRTMRTRGAGRHERAGSMPENILPDGYRDKYGICRYSDIVWMSQTMTDSQIFKAIKMKPATYYRHKKKLRESAYYESLDKNRLQDLNYLQNVKGDLYF